MFGYWNKVINVDLASGAVRVEPLDSDIVSKFIGGMGYSSKVIYDQVGANADPLGTDNVIVFATGPLTGTVPCSGRLDVSTKSPLNGLISMGNVGGGLGVALKQAGYDVLMVRNISPKPVYILVDDDKVEVRKADDLWGRDTQDTTDILTKELGGNGAKFKVAAIGPAGENKVKFASMISEYYHAAGRSGIGGVMGAKKLKAIAVRGTKKVPVEKSTELKQAGREVADRLRNLWHPALKPWIPDRWKYDGLLTMDSHYKEGIMGIKNYQTTQLPGWLENNTFAQLEKYSIKPLPSCYRCPYTCFWQVEVNEGKYAGLKHGGYEHGSLYFLFGALCAILGLPALWKCKDVCNKLGMDYWSAGRVLAFAMELYQRGIITKTDTGGIGLNWGDDDAALQMLEQMAYRRGVGNILADGTATAAKKMGKEAMKYAYTIKGDEVMFHDPREASLPGKSKFYVFGMMFNNRGADNIKVTHSRLDAVTTAEGISERYGVSPEEYSSKFVEWLDIFEDEKRQIFGVPTATGWEGRAALAKWSGDLCAMLNSLTYCIIPWIRFGAVGPTHCAKMLSASTGEEVTPAQLMKTGERIYNLQRMYLLNCGFTSKDDEFPDKFYEAIPDGPAKGTRLSKEDIDRGRQEYYQLRGWDKKGVPSAKKLRELGLTD